MSHSLSILAGDVSLSAELNNSPTAEAILDLLPLETAANRWGDEFYFEIPVETELEPGAEAEVEVGAIAFWPPGNAFCIFFGPTPASRGSMPCAASPVNVVGQMIDDVHTLRSMPDGTHIHVEATCDN